MSKPATESHHTPPIQSERSLPFTMELALSPPEFVAAGIPLEPPVVVTFTTSETEKRRSSEARRLDDVTGVWAFVSLMSADQSQSLAPPRTDLLLGRTTDSIHPVYQRQDGEAQTIGYATFTDLAVSEPGRYCFRINLVDMNK